MTPRLNLSRLDMPPAGVAKEGSVESDYASRQSTYTESNSCGASSSSDSSSEGVSAEAEKNEETSSQNAKVNNGHHKGKGSGKRARTLLTLEQSRVLHELLQQTCFPSTQVREAVAAKLGLSPRKVQVFFQNKRQKQRKKSNLAAASQPQEQTMHGNYATNGVGGEDMKQHMDATPISEAVPSRNRQLLQDYERPVYGISRSYYRPQINPTYDPQLPRGTAKCMNTWAHRLMDSNVRYTPYPRETMYRQRPTTKAAPPVKQPSSPILSPISSSRMNPTRLPGINELISVCESRS